MFWNGRTEKHQTSTVFLCLVRKNGQHRLFSFPCRLFPHPLQNRVPRVQVLLPLPKNRRKHWVFAGFLFACVAWLWCSLWFRHWVFSSGFTRPQPSSSPPAPETHPKRTRLRLFSPEIGCVSLFLSSFDLQNFWLCFCSLCRYVSQIEAVGDTMQTRCILFDVVQLCNLACAVA